MYVDLEGTIKKKKSFMKIKNDDDLCSAKAIITVVAKLEKHPQWDYIRKDHRLQKGFEEELHKKGNVPLRQSNLEGIKNFNCST